MQDSSAAPARGFDPATLAWFRLKAAQQRAADAGIPWVPPEREQARRDSRARNRAARTARRTARRRAR